MEIAALKTLAKIAAKNGDRTGNGKRDGICRS
jgi:hypothetical protein